MSSSIAPVVSFVMKNSSLPRMLMLAREDVTRIDRFVRSPDPLFISLMARSLIVPTVNDGSNSTRRAFEVIPEATVKPTDLSTDFVAPEASLYRIVSGNWNALPEA